MSARGGKFQGVGKMNTVRDFKFTMGISLVQIVEILFKPVFIWFLN
jgi:hypothetical protein